jgi:hypothetical protein
MIHNGDRTHHHDQVITPVSLSTISVITAIWTAAAGTDSLRHRTLGRGRSIRISDTLPAYGAGIEERYGGMSANLDQAAESIPEPEAPPEQNHLVYRHDRLTRSAIPHDDRSMDFRPDSARRAGRRVGPRPQPGARVRRVVARTAHRSGLKTIDPLGAELLGDLLHGPWPCNL